MQAGCITTKADVSGNLENKYFVMHEPVTQAKHYFYYQVGGSGVVDPAVPNATGHLIDVATNATATAVATATASVIDALSWVAATSSGAHITITYTTAGYAYEMRDSTSSLAKTTFTFNTTTFGQTQADLGATEGDVTFTKEENLFDVIDSRYGDYITDQLRRGVQITFGFSLKDSSASMLRKMFANYGSIIVPDVADATPIAGFGTNNIFKSVTDIAGQLILRPVDLAASSDASEDLTMPKAYMKLGELAFSSENLLVLPVEATGLLDTSKDSFISYAGYGNYNQI
jgi:hypothetical protein